MWTMTIIDALEAWQACDLGLIKSIEMNFYGDPVITADDPAHSRYIWDHREEVLIKLKK